MAPKPTAQQIGRAGELFVAAELNRRGAVATLHLTNTPRVDVIATSPDGYRTANIQVKTKGARSRSWHWDIRKAEAERQAQETDYMVLVDLASEHPEYYICRLSEIAERCVERHRAWLKKYGGRRPRNQRSTHMTIPMEVVSSGRNAWDILRLHSADEFW